MNLKLYPEYIDSGVPWIGEVPEHWETIPLCALSKLKAITNCVDLELLSVYLDKGVIRFSDVNEKRTNATSEDLSSYQKVEPGDFVLNNQQAWRGSVGVSKYTGIVSPAYLVLAIDNKLCSDYTNYIFRDKTMVAHYLVSSKGVGSIQRNLYWPQLKRVPIFVPPLSEQSQIARYLDWKTSQIAKFIKNKKRLIELLKEQKQVIINDAVTGKIDVLTCKPYLKYKDSGVAWLGQVPEDWEIIQIKYISNFNPSKTETGYKNDSCENVVFLPMEKISTNGDIDCSEIRKYKNICNGFTYFKKNDVIIAKITPCFENGKGAYLDQLCTEYGFGTTELITIRPSNKVSGMYLRLILSSKWFLKIAEAFMTGSAGQKRISPGFISNFIIGLPDISMQSNIIKFTKKISLSINQAISRTEREISLIQEYRDRLIADAVTGKIDVRYIKIPDFQDEIIAEDIDSYYSEVDVEETNTIEEKA